MSDKPAKRDKLSFLHQRFADFLHDLLDEAVRVDDDGNPVGMPLDAATMNVIRGFLKDNDITCDPAEVGDLNKLREKFSRASQGVSGALKAAEDDLHGGLH